MTTDRPMETLVGAHGTDAESRRTMDSSTRPARCVRTRCGGMRKMRCDIVQEEDVSRHE